MLRVQRKNLRSLSRLWLKLLLRLSNLLQINHLLLKNQNNVLSLNNQYIRMIVHVVVIFVVRISRAGILILLCCRHKLMRLRRMMIIPDILKMIWVEINIEPLLGIIEVRVGIDLLCRVVMVTTVLLLNLCWRWIRVKILSWLWNFILRLVKLEESILRKKNLKIMEDSFEEKRCFEKV